MSLPKKILEIGCGQGFNTYLFSQSKNNKVTGIDLSKEDISIAKERLSILVKIQVVSRVLLEKLKNIVLLKNLR